MHEELRSIGAPVAGGTGTERHRTKRTTVEPIKDAKIHLASRTSKAKVPSDDVDHGTSPVAGVDGADRMFASAAWTDKGDKVGLCRNAAVATAGARQDFRKRIMIAALMSMRVMAFPGTSSSRMEHFPPSPLPSGMSSIWPGGDHDAKSSRN